MRQSQASQAIVVGVGLKDRLRTGLRHVWSPITVWMADEGSDDRALQLLIRRTPAPNRGAARGGEGGESARAGHTRTAMHRTTGK